MIWIKKGIITMKKIIAMIVSCMMLGCTFVSCGNKDSSSEKEAASTTASAEDKTTEASEENTTEDSTEETSEEETEEKTESETEDKTEDKGSDNGSLEEKVLGKWESSKLVGEGIELTEFMGLPVSAMLHMEFKKDGICTFESPMDETEKIECDWKVTGENTFTVDIPEEDGTVTAQIFEYKDGILIVSDPDAGDANTGIHLKSVDEFSEFDMEKWAEDMQNALSTMDIEFDEDDINFDVE